MRRHPKHQRIDDSPATEATAELVALLDAFPPQAIDSIRDILDLLTSEPENFYVVRGYRPPTDGTVDAVVRLEPSLVFRELIAALRIRANEAQRSSMLVR